MKLDLAVIILNFNTKQLLKSLLASVENSYLGNYKIRVIVIDNGSTDGSQDYLRSLVKSKNKKNKGLNKSNDLKIILNKENLGYSKANICTHNCSPASF